MVENWRGMLLFAVGLAFVTPLHAQTEESCVRVMSYNVYRGGEMRGQPLSQTAKAIQQAKADIVGLQEMRSPKGDNGEKLAQLLGWNHDGKQSTSRTPRRSRRCGDAQ
jgi:endonuclease/exonuclease/phosphatase family metal-dependent hydrolase